jgi:hypothetical protein
MDATCVKDINRVRPFQHARETLTDDVDFITRGKKRNELHARSITFWRAIFIHM